MDTKILFIEDDSEIVRFVNLELVHEGYSVTIARDGREGLELALSGKHDIIILDIMLPYLSGLDVLSELRKRGIYIPVIMLTARIEIADRIVGLDSGATDYMTKPFDIEELFARIRAHLRKPEELSYGALSINTKSQKVVYGDSRIDLSKKEYDLLVFLLQNKDKMLTRDSIYASVWGSDFLGSTNNVDVHISYLRNKIDIKYNINMIETVRGRGYMVGELDSDRDTALQLDEDTAGSSKAYSTLDDVAVGTTNTAVDDSVDINKDKPKKSKVKKDTVSKNKSDKGTKDKKSKKH